MWRHPICKLVLFLVIFLEVSLDIFFGIFFAVAFFRMLLISGWNSFQQAAISVPFFGVHQFCWITFRWRVVARDKISLSILAYWMGYTLYSIMYLAMFRQQTIFFDIYDCNFWKESFCTWSQTYRDQQWINWKQFFFWEKIFDNEEHEHYQYKLLPGQKHTLSFVFVFELEFLFFICCDTNCGDSQKSFLLHCCQMI